MTLCGLGRLLVTIHGLWMCLGTLFAALLLTLSCGPSPSPTHTAVPGLTLKRAEKYLKKGTTRPPNVIDMGAS